MNPRASQYRKLLYAALILAIFVAMIPYSIYLDGVKAEYDLGEAQLGQVDAGDFMLNLALIGGFRGMAVNQLWMQARDHQIAQDYDQLDAKVDLITKLQPHYLTVWTYQGWNLAYNVSVEWDDVKDKYDWIKRGIKFLQKGVSKNRTTPDLMWDTAWTYYHKIGYADEAIFLRRLFHDDIDEDFRRYVDVRADNVLSPAYDDNFRLAFGWFVRSQHLVDSGLNQKTDLKAKIDFVDPPEQHKGKPGDLAFHSMPSHSLTKYAIYLEKESKLGIRPQFGEVARLAWQNALNEWQGPGFGRREFEAFNDPQGNKVYLDDYTLPPEEFAKLPETRRYWTDRWATQMNYPYWKQRAQAEMEDEGLKARELFYKGRKALKEGDFVASIEAYAAGLALWKELLDRFDSFREDTINQQDTGQIVNYYIRALKQDGREIPADTPFLELGQRYANERVRDPFDALEEIPDSLYQSIQERFRRGTSANASASAEDTLE